VHLTVLGHTRLDSFDGSSPPLTPTDRRLLAVLAIDCRRAWSVSELAEALWGESDSNRLKTVRNRVSDLRTRHGKGIIRTIGAGYQIDGEITVDTDELVAMARRKDLPSDFIRSWLQAKGGRPYEDIETWPGASAAIAKLELCRLHLEEHLVAVELDEGESPDAAAAALEELVSAQPFRESRWALLMRAYAMGGQRREAALAYRRAFSALSEAGLSPGEELRRLESLILEGRENLGPILPNRSGSLPFPVSSLVGRTARDEATS
jgi:DNA-binding SARP family transcriptional activator